ncbi:hypothetical protein C8R44DRAFT_227338 [Mycena epipterygia]|nr:hypothetical protein C8R44DRAFT_227338 [Mycena epipterygia]
MMTMCIVHRHRAIYHSRGRSATQCSSPRPRPHCRAKQNLLLPVYFADERLYCDDTQRPKRRQRGRQNLVTTRRRTTAAQSLSGSLGVQLPGWPEDEPRVAAAVGAHSSSGSGGHHHLPTLHGHGLGHFTTRQSVNLDTSFLKYSRCRRHHLAAPHRLDARRWPLAHSLSHGILRVTVMHVPRGIRAHPQSPWAECAAAGGRWMWRLRYRRTTARRGGDVRESNGLGHDAPAGMCHGPSQSDSSYRCVSFYHAFSFVVIFLARTSFLPFINSH